MSNDQQKRIYIAGAVSGLPEDDVHAKFQRAEDIYSALNFDVFNPFSAIREENLHEASWQTIMKHCIAALLGCDALVLLHDWKQSQGACMERDIALKLSIPVYYPHQSFDKPLEIQ